MRQLATFLSHYAPFKWMYLDGHDKTITLIGTLTGYLWTHFIMILIAWCVMFIRVFHQNIRWQDKIKVLLICFPIIPIDCFFSYFLINDVLIMAITIIVFVLFFIFSFEDVGMFENGGGWVFSSLISYFEKVKIAKDRLIRYTNQYNELVNFKF